MSTQNGTWDHDLDPVISLSAKRAQVRTVILAGGTGTRLRPYTAVLPKPLMPLGDRAILEFVIDQLAEQGFSDITLSVGHLAHVVEAVFGDGASHGVEINYVREEVPLGTAGSLRLVEGLDGTFLVLNGDLVTSIDYRSLIRAHRAGNNVLTIATTNRQVKMDYGLLDLGDAKGALREIAGYREKPVIDCMVSMGIYVLEPEALEFAPADGHFDFPQLVQRALAAGAPIGAFVYDGLWLDIGRHEDYEQAVTLWEAGAFDSVADEHAEAKNDLAAAHDG